MDSILYYTAVFVGTLEQLPNGYHYVLSFFQAQQRKSSKVKVISTMSMLTIRTSNASPIYQRSNTSILSIRIGTIDCLNTGKLLKGRIMHATKCYVIAK